MRIFQTMVQLKRFETILNLFEYLCDLTMHIFQGFYYLKNFIPSMENLPFQSPWTKIKYRAKFYETETEKVFATGDVYGHYIYYY